MARCIDGQLSLWDIAISEKLKKVTKSIEKFAKQEVLCIKQDVSFTEAQQKVIEKYKAHPDISRIILQYGGGVNIELREGEDYRTIYVNKAGDEEFAYNKKSFILPRDKIIYYNRDFKSNELQEQRLEEVRACESIERVIRRKGDENILVQLQDRVVCITAKGWKLNIKGKALYTDEEVEQKAVEEPIDIEAARRNAKVGDVIEADCAGKVIRGIVRSVYGTRDMTLNILYDNETKCTAICRVNITRILISA